MLIRFYHHTNQSTGRCQCNTDHGCCIKKSSAPPDTDCSIYNTHGSKRCNSIFDGTACEWVCQCKNITDAEVCVESTCLAQPNLTCVYSKEAGCDCPSCCKDHPDKNNAFDCATRHMLGTRRCNRVLGGRTCQWTCACSDIENEETCLLSTCIGSPRQRCRFNGRSCFCK